MSKRFLFMLVLWRLLSTPVFALDTIIVTCTAVDAAVEQSIIVVSPNLTDVVEVYSLNVDMDRIWNKYIETLVTGGTYEKIEGRTDSNGQFVIYITSTESTASLDLFGSCSPVVSVTGGGGGMSNEMASLLIGGLFGLAFTLGAVWRF